MEFNVSTVVYAGGCRRRWSRQKLITVSVLTCPSNYGKLMPHGVVDSVYSVGVRAAFWRARRAHKERSGVQCQ